MRDDGSDRAAEPSPEDAPTIREEPVTARGTGATLPGHRRPSRTPVLPPYVDLVEIARGGMGAVYRAVDPEIGRPVAIKFILAGDQAHPDEVRRFRREARITGRLQHPGIPPLYEIGCGGEDRNYFAMKLIEGQSLRTILDGLRQRGPAALARARDEIISSLARVCEALAYAHSRGVVHRDLKPANVMVGEFGEVLVVDWGLAKLMEDREEPRVGDDPPRTGEDPLQTLPGSILGTPAYMSPEQVRGQVGRIDARTDIYQIGAILFELVSGRPPGPWTGPTTERRHPLEGLPASVPFEIVYVLKKCLADDPADRYGSALALRDDLVAYLEGRSLAAARYSPWQIAAKWVARHRTLVLSALVVAFVAAASLTVSLLRIRSALIREMEQTRRAEAATESAERAGESARAAHRLEERRRAEAEENLALAFLAAAREAAARENSSAAAVLAARSLAYAENREARTLYLEQRPRAVELLALLGDPLEPVVDVVLDAAGRSILVGTGRGRCLLLEAATGRVRVQLDVPSPVECAAFSRDGDLLLAGHRAGEVSLWNPLTGELLLRRAGNGIAIDSIDVSAGNRRFLSRSSDGTLRVFDLPDGLERWSARGTSAAVAPVFESSGDRVLFIGEERVNIVRSDSGRRVLLLAGGDSDPATGAAFGSDGRRVLTWFEGTARLWDAGTGQALASIGVDLPGEVRGDVPAGAKSVVHSATFSPDGQRLLIRFRCPVHPWRGLVLADAESGRTIAPLSLGRTAPRESTFSLDGSLLVGAGDPLDIDGDAIAVWDGRTGQSLGIVRTERLEAMAALADGVSCATPAGTITEWTLSGTSLEKRRTFSAVPGRVLRFGLSTPSGTVFALGDDGTLRLWGPRNGPVRELDLPMPDIVESPDGRYVYGKGTVHDLLGRDSRAIPGHPEGASVLGLSLDGSLFAVRIGPFDIEVREVETNALRFSVQDPDGRPVNAWFSGNALLVDSGAGTLRVVDPLTSVDIASVRYDVPLRWASLDPSGRRLVGETKGAVHVWDLTQAEPIAILLSERPGNWRPEVRFDREGRSIAVWSVEPDDESRGVVDRPGSGDDVVRVVELETGHERTRLVLGSRVLDAFLLSASVAVTSEIDGGLRIWRLDLGEVKRLDVGAQRVKRILGHERGALWVQCEGSMWSDPTGRVLAVDVETGEIRAELKDPHVAAYIGDGAPGALLFSRDWEAWRVWKDPLRGGSAADLEARLATGLELEGITALPERALPDPWRTVEVPPKRNDLLDDDGPSPTAIDRAAESILGAPDPAMAWLSTFRSTDGHPRSNSLRLLLAEEVQRRTMGRGDLVVGLAIEAMKALSHSKPGDADSGTLPATIRTRAEALLRDAAPHPLLEMLSQPPSRGK